MAYTKYSLTPANNNATPPDGAPEGMLPSAVNDTMRDMMAQIRDVGDGIRNGTYTMTAPVITGGSITGVALSGNTFTNPVITGGSINNTPIGASTANTGAFTTLSASGVATFSAGTVSAPAITTTGDTNTGIFFPAADTIAFTEGGVESMRIDSSGNVGIGINSPSYRLHISSTASTAGYFTSSGSVTTIDLDNTNANGWGGNIAIRTGGTAAGYFGTIGSLLGSTAQDLAVYATASNGFRVYTNGNNERMRIDSSGNVGIGTSSPTQQLTVGGSGNILVAAGGTIFSSGRLYIRSGSGQPLDFGANNANSLMQLDIAGNLGLGVTPSAWRTDFNGRALQLNNASFATFNDDSLYVAQNSFLSSTGWRYTSTRAATLYFQNAGVHGWSTATSGTAGDAISFSERMRIDSSGNVGIGTSSPGSALNVARPNGTATYLQLSQTSLESWQIGMAGSSSALAFLNSGTERMRITSAGRVGIGTSSPASLLHVASSDAQITCSNADASVYTYMLRDGFYSVGGRMDIYTGGANAQTFWTNANERMRITSAGDVYIGATAPAFGSRFVVSKNGGDVVGFTSTSGVAGDTILTIKSGANGTDTTTVYTVFQRSDGVARGNITATGTNGVVYNTSSDYRLKNITGKITGYKERIMALQPKQGTWKEDGSEFKGFLAHEFAEQYPNAVSGEKDAVDAEGNPMYQGMQAGGSETIADLVAFVQEQQAMIEELKQEVAALKANH